MRTDSSGGLSDAIRFYPASFELHSYMDRTARNQFWVGGLEGQKAIQKLSIGVAGTGGMGSNIAEQLVRLGVGHVRIADRDTIEPTNLNRQVFATQSTLGKPKIEAAVQALRNIAEDFELVAYEKGIHAETVERFVSGCDAIVDEIDVYELEAHVLLHRAARARGIPLYSAYAVGFGIHFYKFRGDCYTFEDFLGNRPEQWKKPTADFLLERIGRPYPSYFTPDRLSEFTAEISAGGAPIFGPTTLIGHSIVTLRLVLDLLVASGQLAADYAPTPVMPEFLVLDLADLNFRAVSALR
jgi:molybdopterin/thiamine biosynthesis adenylyltransferase